MSKEAGILALTRGQHPMGLGMLTLQVCDTTPWFVGFFRLSPGSLCARQAGYQLSPVFSLFV